MSRENDIDILARTIWAEARGEGIIGMEAVACVVLNRLAVAKEQGKWWWGSTVEEICLKPYQFSCWNENDPNRSVIYTISAENKVFREALEIAEDAVDGMIPDFTNGATHYLNPHVLPKLPSWARKLKPVSTFGNHHFYRPPEVPTQKEKEKPWTQLSKSPSNTPKSLSEQPLPSSADSPYISSSARRQSSTTLSLKSWLRKFLKN